MKNKTINALIEMGMPADIKGFTYIIDAMCLFEDRVWRKSKLMALYQKIGELNETTPLKVERAMRHAFSVVLLKGNLKTVQKYLTFDNTSNGNLLHILYLRLEQEEQEK